MLSAGELDELGRDVNVVGRVVNGLAATSANVVLIPAVAVKFVLLAGMSESCIS